MPETEDIQEEIAIRSEDVQEILSFVPNWMIRWGNTMILILILGLLLISWFVKYPDTIPTEITITTQIPPEKLYAKTNGRLDAILVNDREVVSENKILAIIENASNYKDVLLLKNIIDTLTVNYKDFYFPLEDLPLFFLGDIDTDFALFERAYAEYKLNNELQPFSNESIANKLSITETRSRINTLVSQQNLNKQELALKKTDLERYKMLYEKDIISPQEYDQKKLDYLGSQRSYRSINASISLLRESINNSQKDLRGTEIRKAQDDNKALKSVIQSYSQLKKSLKNWELNFVLKSSIDGEVSFMSFWNENQTVNQGDLVFTIVSKGSNSFIGKIKAPIRNSGKIKIGQTVNIRLSNYPYIEFGILEGTIKSISLVPDIEGYYLIDVALPDKLITTYNKDIEFKQEMRGTAEIITEDVRLIERFFYRLMNIFKK